MKAKHLITGLLVLIVFGHNKVYAESKDSLKTAWIDVFEMAGHLHDAGKYSLADCRYMDLISSMSSVREETSWDFVNEIILRYIDNSLSLHDYPRAVTTLTVPAWFAPEDQARHAVLLARAVREIMPKHTEAVLDWLDYADSTLNELKLAGMDVIDIEYPLLNELGAVYGRLDMTDSLISVIARIKSVGELTPTDKRWPSDAYWWYALELMKENRLQEAEIILKNVIRNKLEFDVTQVYPAVIVYTVLCGLTDDTGDLDSILNSLLDVLDEEMSRQGIQMSYDQFYHYFREELFLDVMSFAAVADPVRCSGVLYDALLTLNNMRQDIQMDMLAYADTCKSKSFSNLYNLIRTVRDSEVGDAADYSYVDCIGSLTDLPIRSHRYSWQDVRDALTTQDIAVEFFLVPHKEPQLAALVLRKGYSKPEMVRLCLLSDLKSEVNKGVELYREGGKSIYNLIWRPLESKLEGARRVFYSPVGDMRILNMDAIICPEGDRLMSEVYDMNMLSSTAKLIRPQHSPDYKAEIGDLKALVYGGLEFYPDSVDWKKASLAWNWARFARKTEYLFDGSGFLIPELSAVSVRYLHNSLKEVREIAEEISSEHVFLRTGLAGIEEDFRNDYDAGIMHFATHAFCLDDDEILIDEMLAGLDFSYVSTKELSAFKRCGLLFSGAGNTMEGTKPSGVFDGIIYGDNIAARDFRNTDLVVLSACGTALGDVHEAGVYGLQRAFKRAGANTIIMSLWNVNDVSTAHMMTEFYKYLMSGDSKREAFGKARASVREKYKDPYYWAPFIMLD